MKNIRTLIVHEDENVARNIANLAKTYDEFEVIGIAKNEEEAMEEIIEKKPEVIFTEYNLKSMNGLDLIKYFKDKLVGYTPILNFMITEEIKESELKELIRVATINQINSIIRAPYEQRIRGIMEDYICLKAI